MSWDEIELLDFVRAMRDEWLQGNIDADRDAVTGFVDFIHERIYEMGRDA